MRRTLVLDLEYLECNSKEITCSEEMKSILIANRGEIALRIISTARKLGLRTIAIYSDADYSNPHAQAADQAFNVGGAVASESYLNAAKILSVAIAAKADAIHPGYGFLSENPDFARQTIDAGLIFIGPDASAMRSLGHKDSARKLASKIGIPVIPGYDGEKTDLATLVTRAQDIGFPLLIKARAGGGGRGMREVNEVKDLQNAIEAAKRESKAYFGDEHLILEKLIQRARHIEIQILADHFGNALHFWERDCTLQRRAQKIVEESPSAYIEDELRAKLCESALKLIKACNYTNAATVEFLIPLDKNNMSKAFFFLEANCRIQVEHPITEMIFGIDLIEWQIRIARGEKLSLSQSDIKPTGVAIEARVYAEAPQQKFLPKSGRVADLTFPEIAQSQLRIDHALEKGLTISTNYDSLLMKLIASGETRLAAIERLRLALQQTRICGVQNNISFLLSILSHQDVASNNTDTKWVDRKIDELIESSVISLSLAKVAMSVFLIHEIFSSIQLHLRQNPNDPFCTLIYWRPDTSLTRAKTEIASTFLDYDMREHGVDLTQKLRARLISYAKLKSNKHIFTLGINDGVHEVCVEHEPSLELRSLQIEFDGVAYKSLIDSATEMSAANIYVEEKSFSIYQSERSGSHAGAASFGETQVVAPLPGTVIDLLVKPKDVVKKGTVIAIIESMKIEHSILCTDDAIIKDILVTVGMSVNEGQELVLLGELSISDRDNFSE